MRGVFEEATQVRLSLFCILCASVANAAVQGTVTNGTTGKPQAGVSVTVMKLEGGMVPVGEATTAAGGRFRIDAPPPSGQLPHLVRADYKGVGYFGAARTADADLALTVYDTTTDKSSYRLTAHQVVLEPHTGQMMVLETYTVNNTTAPPKTYYSEGSFQFALPSDEVTELSVSATGPGQLPLRQSPVSKGKGQYGLDYAFRPGETRLEISYKIPYQDGFVFKQPAIPGPVETEVIAPMEGVTVKGEHLKASSTDESKRAAFYTWTGKRGLELTISGALPDAAPGAASGEEGGELSTVERPSFVTESRWPVLTVLLAALAFGLLHLYRMERQGAQAPPK
jgi:hypothetical protein